MVSLFCPPRMVDRGDLPCHPLTFPHTQRLFLGTPHTSSTVRKASVWPYSFLLTRRLAPRYYLCVTICSLGSSKFSSLVYGCQMPKRGSPHIHSPAKNQETCHVNSKVIEDTKHKGTPFFMVSLGISFLTMDGLFLLIFKLIPFVLSLNIYTPPTSKNKHETTVI